MKNKKIWLGLIILALVFTLSSCGEDIFTVPEWARGDWYINEGTEIINQVKAVTITSNEFRPTEKLTQTLGKVLGNKKVTYSTNDKAVFDIITVTKGSDSNEISIGVTGIGGKLTVYKFQP